MNVALPFCTLLVFKFQALHFTFSNKNHSCILFHMAQENEAVERPFELIYKFVFKGNSKDSIYEVKYVDVPQDSKPALKFQWFVEQGGVKQNLQFKSMNGKQREFTNGIVLDMLELTMRTRQGAVYELEAVSK